MTVRGKYPGLKTLISVFLTTFVLFSVLPPFFLKTDLFTSFFNDIGRYNAGIHHGLLNIVGVDSVVVSNILYLQSGAGLEYSPYCFGFLTVTGLAILILTLPSLRFSERLRWIAGGSFLILLINQERILLELLIALIWPAALPTADVLLYPILPATALMWWQKGLKTLYNTSLSPESENHAGG